MTALTQKRFNHTLYQKRKFINKLGLIFTLMAMGFGLFWLSWILWTLFGKGLVGLFDMPIFSADTPAPMMNGGLRNAIVGSLMLTLTALAIGTPVGIMTGIYLAEFAGSSFLGKAIRFINDILLFAPSIVVGLFVFSLMVQGRGFSGWAGRWLWHSLLCLWWCEVPKICSFLSPMLYEKRALLLARLAIKW